MSFRRVIPGAFFYNWTENCFTYAVIRRKQGKGLYWSTLCGLGLVLLTASLAMGQTADPAATPAGSGASGISISLNGGDQPEDLSIAIQLVIVMTLLTLAPTMVMLMTCFTRIVIVLGFVRTAIGVNQSPSNQIILGLALFLSIFVMGPTFERIYSDAVLPYMDKEIDSREALSRASVEMKGFMLAQTEEKNVEFMLSLANLGPTTVEDLPMRVVIPAFILSEIKTAFQMGFMIFVPFIVVDFIIASSLMSMGMMMMPPTMIALPFKILLFVLVDGWSLIIGSLVKSFVV